MIPVLNGIFFFRFYILMSNRQKTKNFFFYRNPDLDSIYILTLTRVCFLIHIVFCYRWKSWMMADTEHPCTKLPSKRPRLTCIIHCSDDTDNLITPKSVDSWNTLLRAAQIRQHDPILELAKDTPEGEIPALNYHRKCRSIFTMKKAPADIIAQKKKTASGSHARVGRASPSTSRTYEANCIFCQKN